MAHDGRDSLHGRWYRWLPPTALGRVRLAALAYAAIGLLALAPQLDRHLAAWRDALSAAGAVWLLAAFAVTYSRRRVIPAEPIVSGLAIVAMGAALTDPYTTIGLCLVTVATQTLYGSAISALVRLVAVCFALPVTVAVSPTTAASDASWHSATVFGVLPGIVLTAVLMRALLSSLTRQEQATARANLLAEAGTRLINLTDLSELRAVTRQAAIDLCTHSPGVGLMLLDVGDDAAVVTGVGSLPGISLGMEFPVSMLEPVNPRRGAPGTDRIEQLDPIVGRRRWRAVAIDVRPRLRLLLVGGRHGVSDAVLASFHMLAAQRTQAEANYRSRTALEHQAGHDSLTGLANRRELISRLGAQVDASVTGDDVGLIVMDLDDFKLINDTYGHGLGDELLIAVATRLRELAGERGLAARLGGDEFAVMVVNAAAAFRAQEVAREAHRVLHEPVRLSTATVSPGASIGVAIGEPQLTAGDLIRCADIAMYWAKARGKGRVEQYSTVEHGDVAEIRQLEEHLAEALSRGEIVVHYQPLVDVAAGRCVGVEAVPRWQHPTRGLLMPATFLPMAERRGQISAIGTHLLRTACRQTAHWLDQPGMEQLRTSVNLSRGQLLDGNFPDLVRRTLAETGLPPDRLTLELTEAQAIDDQGAIRQLCEVADLGVRLAIQDFGRGQASLTPLDRFPLHQLKIDRSFLVRRGDSTAQAMLQLVVSVAQILDVETVAEGVETEEQARIARSAGVPLAQGFLFAKPMTAEEFQSWFSSTLRPASA